MSVSLLAAVLSGYLIGAVPTGLLLARAAGIDIRSHGSGNIGATNVSRTLGKKLGALTLIGDIAKAVFPMLLVARFLPAGEKELGMALAGAAAFLGHCYPVYLGFQGGKGVATALGVFLVLTPAAVFVEVVLFGLIVRLTGYVSVGSLAAAALLPLLVWLFNRSAIATSLAGAIALVVWIKHRGNIDRLLRREEKSWNRR